MRDAFVHEAELRLEPGVDPGAVGAAVTVELCGHWEHDGPCRWPHNNAIEPNGDVANFRTVFIATAGEEPEVRGRIERSLRGSAEWLVVGTSSRDVSDDERPLADRLGRA